MEGFAEVLVKAESRLETEKKKKTVEFQYQREIEMFTKLLKHEWEKI